jgi:hypothetical protein
VASRPIGRRFAFEQSPERRWKSQLRKSRTVQSADVSLGVVEAPHHHSGQRPKCAPEARWWTMALPDLIVTAPVPRTRPLTVVFIIGAVSFTDAWNQRGPHGIEGLAAVLMGGSSAAFCVVLLLGIAWAKRSRPFVLALSRIDLLINRPLIGVRRVPLSEIESVRVRRVPAVRSGPATIYKAGGLFNPIVPALFIRRHGEEEILNMGGNEWDDVVTFGPALHETIVARTSLHQWGPPATDVGAPT